MSLKNKYTFYKGTKMLQSKHVGIKSLNNKYSNVSQIIIVNRKCINIMKKLKMN